MIHQHDCLVGGLIRQAGSQADCAAGQDSLGVWLLLLMQKGVAHCLRTARAVLWVGIDTQDCAWHREEALRLVIYL